MTDYTYPFDPYGTASTNLITNENQVLTPANGDNYHYIVPKWAPYFLASLKIYHAGSSRYLVEGIDYYGSHWFHAASHLTELEVYGSITFVDTSLSGTVTLEYQTIGLIC